MMFWIITSIILGVITLLTLISNSIKNDEIAALKYSVIYLSSEDDMEKARENWERFKG